MCEYLWILFIKMYNPIIRIYAINNDIEQCNNYIFQINTEY